MKHIIALHGNPGAPQDWSLLKNHAADIKAVDAYSDQWMSDVLQSPNKVILLGHSWGAYRILKALPALAANVEKVVLIAPYVNIERPLSGIAQLLLNTPFIGDMLIQSNHKKSKDSFLDDLIYPFKVEGLAYYQEIEGRLQDWQAWQKTAMVKMQMQSNPLNASDVCQVPIEVFYGSDDKISNADFQNQILSKYPKINIHHLQNTGHGLLWSHPELISKELL
ncbi:alpha/beta fold hydrolase [Bdellovibrio sp. HCB209]|uniref:alpha/beta fold hydrolase n=1 Tax=Bdellovibrio sp. HCB209 TaxID=3394354 RepID=UPI0039B4BF50